MSKVEVQTAGGNKPVHTAKGNGAVSVPGDVQQEVELAEILILFSRRKLVTSMVRTMTLVVTSAGPWIQIREGGVTRILSAVGVMMTPKGQPKAKVEVS